jgi:hypothetical protein
LNKRKKKYNILETSLDNRDVTVLIVKHAAFILLLSIKPPYFIDPYMAQRTNAECRTIYQSAIKYMTRHIYYHK